MKKIIGLTTLIICLNIYGNGDGLKIGEKVPNLIVKDTFNNDFDFSNQKKDTIVVFFRGSWCPYCITQLKQLEKEVYPKLKTNTQMVAISVDKLKVAKKMKDKFNLRYKVLSDPKAKSLEAFKIINQLTSELVIKYKNSYQIDVEGDSGETHHMVAHPAIFIIKNGKISFADVQKDYKQRTDNSLILKNL